MRLSASRTLDEMLNGRARTVENVQKLLAFADHHGIHTAVFPVCKDFLAANNAMPAPISKSKYKNVIEELEAEGSIYDALEREGIIKLPRVSREIKLLVDRMVAEGRTLTPADIELFQRMPRA